MDGRELNRAWWDERAALHGQDRVYDTDAFLTGAVRLRPLEVQVVGDVTAQRVIHLQCHTGMDTLSWLRLGAADVTGVDFSAVAIEKARHTAEAARLAEHATFVRSDVLAVPHELHGGYDVCFASFGVLSWIGDVCGWMRTAAAVLRPGGRLALIDFHPLFQMVDSIDPFRLDFPYAHDGPHPFSAGGSYAQPDAVTVANETEEYAHSLGEIVTAAIDAGLRVDSLGEHLDLDRDGRGLLPQEADGRYRLRIDWQALPLAYSLRATVPA